MPCLYVIITADIERFHYFNFEIRFLKKWNFFCKELEYWILVQKTTIGTGTFPKKPSLSKANIRANSMGNTEWACHKERSFVTNSLIFLKTLLILKTSYKQLIHCTNYPNIYILTFRMFVNTWILFEGAFFLWVSIT